MRYIGVLALFLSVSLLSASCSNHPGSDESTITFNIQRANPDGHHIANFVATPGQTPTSIGDFNCFGIMYRNPDHGQGNCVDSSDDVIWRFDKLAGFKGDDSQLQMTVSQGSDRKFHLVAVSADTSNFGGCPTFQNLASASGGVSAMYKLGTTSVNIEESPMTVAMSGHFSNATPYTIDCDHPDFNMDQDQGQGTQICDQSLGCIHSFFTENNQGMYQDTGCSLASITSPNPVKCWNNLAGTNKFTEATNNPDYSSATLNGYPGITFNGTTILTTDFNASTSGTILIALKTGSLSTTTLDVMSSSDGVDYLRAQLNYSSGFTFQLLKSGIGPTTGVASISSSTAYVLAFSWSATEVATYVNGVNEDYQTGSSSSLTSAWESRFC